ncbi:MAG: hypothetical protein IBGAMO2_590002 [Arenicellales bacterium IbO2]|nr:MAG: hypothetical protein IBGAMO2_590002 [Arenicellales bacterium IbO2]
MDDEEAVVLSVDPANLCKVVTDPPTEFTEQVVLTARLRRSQSASGDIPLKLGTRSFTGGHTVNNFPGEITIQAGKASASTTFTIAVETVPENKELDITGKIKDSNGIGVVSAKLPIREFNLDVDGSGAANAWDGIMAMRYLIGVHDEKLTAGQSNAAHAVVAKNITDCRDSLNVDGNKEPNWRDGTLIARYLLGLRDKDLVMGLGIPPINAPGVEANINKLCPLGEDGVPVCE